MDNNENNESYIDENEGEKEYCKIILVGESGVGKTSIINQFTTHQFSRDIMSSTGGTFSTKTIEYDINGKKTKIALEIWDTAGQERYRSMAKLFFNDAVCAIIVYDITNTKSFEEIKKYWVNEVKNNTSEKIIIYIVGNKDDLYLEEQVDEDEARNFAKEVNANFKTTSAMKGKNIDEIFYDIGKQYLEKYDDFNGQKPRKKSMIKVAAQNQNKKKTCC